MKFEVDIKRKYPKHMKRFTGNLCIPTVVVKSGFEGKTGLYCVGKAFIVVHPDASYQDVVDSMELSKKEIGMYMKKPGISAKEIKRSIIHKATDFIPGFASELGICAGTEIEAAKILKTPGVEEATYGLSPLMVAAAALRLAGISTCDKRATDKNIFALPGVKKDTIDEYCELLKQSLEGTTKR